MPGPIWVHTLGQSVTVNITATNGAPATVTSDAAGQNPVSMPQTISTDSYYYLSASGDYLLSVKCRGNEVYGQGGQPASVYVDVDQLEVTPVIPAGDLAASLGTVTGSKGGNAALASLISVLAAAGMITDATS